MNRTLLAIAKAIECEHIDGDDALLVLGFIVERRRRAEASADDGVALAEIIRRALVGAESSEDTQLALVILEDWRAAKERARR